MRNHPDERSPWWETALMMRDHPERDHPYERPAWWDRPAERPQWWDCSAERSPWCNSPAERSLWWDRPAESPPWWDHPAERPLWWDRRAERPPWWDHPAERPLWWDHPEERPHLWETTLKRDHPNERLPWRETTVMRNHPDERPLWRETPPKVRPPWWESALRRETTLRRDRLEERPPLFFFSSSPWNPSFIFPRTTVTLFLRPFFFSETLPSIFPCKRTGPDWGPPLHVKTVHLSINTHLAGRRRWWSRGSSSSWRRHWRGWAATRSKGRTSTREARPGRWSSPHPEEQHNTVKIRSSY